MDPERRMLLSIFAKIETGTTWDACWIWTGYLDPHNYSSPLYIHGGRRIRVRPFVRARVHPEVKYGRILPTCSQRCVHPDHVRAIVRARAQMNEPMRLMLEELAQTDNYVRKAR